MGGTVYIPMYPGQEKRSTAQAKLVQEWQSNGYIVTGSEYDKDSKTVIATVLMLPDASTPGFSAITKKPKASLPVPTFAFGEPVEVISAPDPFYKEIEGIMSPSTLIGKKGKFMGLWNGDTKYKGFAAVRFDEFNHCLTDCKGMVSDGHGFFCQLESLRSIAPKKALVGEIKGEIKVGGSVKFVGIPNSSTYNAFIGKEGVVKEIGEKTAVIEYMDIYGSLSTVIANKDSFISTAIFSPPYALKFTSGDLVRIISQDATTSGSQNTNFVGKVAYITGPLSAVKDNITDPQDKLRVQVGVLGTISNAPASFGSKYMESRIFINVNCLEPIAPSQVFNGIDKGDTVTIVDVPDYPKMEEAGKAWIGRQGIFKGFPQPKAGENLNYKYRYAAVLEVEGGKTIYALYGSIAKGLAHELGVFKIGDKVKMIDKGYEIAGISTNTYEKRYKGATGIISTINYSIGHPHHLWYSVSYAGYTVLVPKTILVSGEKNDHK